MTAPRHRLPPRFKIRKGFPQSFLGGSLRSSGVPIEEETVDLEHAVVQTVWHSQILPDFHDCRFETFEFRTEVDSGLGVAVHAKDPRATQNASAD